MFPIIPSSIKKCRLSHSSIIHISDVYGKVLYDSDNSEEIGKTTELSSQMYGLSVNESTEGNSRYSFSVILDNQIVGTVFLTYNEYWVVENAIRKILTLLFLCLSLGIITFILTMGFSVWLLSRSILVPLKELKEATEKIAEGNLDFTVKYAKNDEIGRFSQTFNAMKDRLKDSLEKQQQEENSRKELVTSIH
ncbi:MAG: HAMP domain-containing protein [Clostridiaceae bacterium]|nr:HAMP domain-containing protein [Clostridiaceae bacterium]